MGHKKLNFGTALLTPGARSKLNSASRMIKALNPRNTHRIAIKMRTRKTTKHDRQPYCILINVKI